MTNITDLNRTELAALVGEALAKDGIDVVLTGGSCVSIYTSDQFVSLDLDFIDMSFSTSRRIARSLESIGFTPSRRNSRYFEHPETDLKLEFPPAPLAVGDESIPLEATELMETDQGVLRLLRPTDCVKDRLANYYYFKDRQCYEQALAVARRHPVDWEALERWHENEGQQSGFAIFRAEVER